MLAWPVHSLGELLMVMTSRSVNHGWAVMLGLLILLTGWAGVPAFADAIVEPRVEPIPQKAPNRPYVVRGQRYAPMADDVPFKQRGMSSWYGQPFHGRKTASGETFDMHSLTAAHPTLPIPSYVRVRHVRSGKEVIVRINDRGPFHSTRILDLSQAAAQQLGLLSQGTAEVEIERLTFEDIRLGRWRQAQEPLLAVAVPDEPAQSDPMRALVEVAMADTQEIEAAALPAEVLDVSQQPAEVPAPAVPVQASADAQAAPYWVQLGAFEQEDGATRFRMRVRHELKELGGMLAEFRAGALTHLQLGPFAGPVEAGRVANRVRNMLQLAPIIVQRP
jgi:rare lipoprotein A